MRRVKAEVAIVGNGSAAMLATSRLLGMGVNVVLINPDPTFTVDDLRPHDGLGLWNSAYRAEGNVSLSSNFDQLVKRLREVFPATVEQTELQRTEYWSILSSTPIHRQATEEIENEFFKLERKAWSSGNFRLVNPEHVLARTRRLGLQLSHVAQVEGGIVRNNGIWWNAAKLGLHLAEFIKNKSVEEKSLVCFTNAKISGRFGRKIVFTVGSGEEISVESEQALLIFLTGDLLPSIKTIIASCDESWIQGVRKRRKERHFIWFERHQTQSDHTISDLGWMSLGNTRYYWSGNLGMASWQSAKGPDGLEKVVDEGLRLQSTIVGKYSEARFVRTIRTFRLEWEWKNPQWRTTSHDTYWATGFEGDLWGVMELIWNLPLR